MGTAPEQAHRLLAVVVGRHDFLIFAIRAASPEPSPHSLGQPNPLTRRGVPKEGREQGQTDTLSDTLRSEHRRASWTPVEAKVVGSHRKPPGLDAVGCPRIPPPSTSRGHPYRAVDSPVLPGAGASAQGPRGTGASLRGQGSLRHADDARAAGPLGHRRGAAVDLRLGAEERGAERVGLLTRLRRVLRHTSCPSARMQR